MKRQTSTPIKSGSKSAKSKSDQSFSRFLNDPVVAGALLVFAFVALMFSLQQFLAARGY